MCGIHSHTMNIKESALIYVPLPSFSSTHSGYIRMYVRMYIRTYIGTYMLDFIAPCHVRVCVLAFQFEGAAG